MHDEHQTHHKNDEHPIQIQDEIKKGKKDVHDFNWALIMAVIALVVAIFGMFYTGYLNSNQNTLISDVDLRVSKLENMVKNMRAETQELQESTETSEFSADGLVLKTFESTRGNYSFNYPDTWKVETFEMGDETHNLFFGPQATAEGGLGQLEMKKYDKSVDSYLAEMESEVDFVNTTRGVINGVSVTKTEFEAGDMSGYVVYFIKDGTIYSLQLSSGEIKDKVLFDVIVKSFELK